MLLLCEFSLAFYTQLFGNLTNGVYSLGVELAHKAMNKIFDGSSD